MRIFGLKDIKLKKEEEKLGLRGVYAFTESSVGLRTPAQSVSRAACP